MHLPENLRDKLKQPLGILVRDSETTKEHLLKLIPHGAFLITVGDATTEKLIQYDMIPSLQIVDSVERRSKRELPQGTPKTLLRCTNPAAQITEESIDVIKNAFHLGSPVRIIVNGEEDLLVLPVVVHAPENSVVLYGQPNEGLVVVKIDNQTRSRAKSIMNMMSV